MPAARDRRGTFWVGLQGPTSNNLEKLQSNVAGYRSIRINDQRRLTFQVWDNGTRGRGHDLRLSLTGKP
jgi:plasmid maintenance system killer protein